MSDDTISALALEFGIRDHVDFMAGPAGVPQLGLTNAYWWRPNRTSGGAGAFVGAFWAGRPDLDVPRRQIPPGVSLRGGIPICGPWFGPRKGASGLPVHGFARKELWEIVASGISDDGRVCVDFRLMSGRTPLVVCDPGPQSGDPRRGIGTGTPHPQ